MFQIETLAKFAVVAASLCLAACAPYRASESELSGTSVRASINGSSLVPTPEGDTQKVEATEMQAMELEFSSAVTDVNTAPHGSVWDQARRILSWIPALGSAGSHHIELRLNNGSALRIRLVVRARESQELAQGPMAGWSVGDVGFVFVHGAGEEDRCQPGRAEAYWGPSLDLIAPAPLPRKVVCYDARLAFEGNAVSVAQQILQAECGRFGKCVVVTHSTGGLLMNHILTHRREARASDPEPELFAPRALYQQVFDKTVVVVNFGSSAGGSKVASLAENPSRFGIDRDTLELVQPIIGYGPSGYTRANQVDRASEVLAPVHEDPGVPFYMIAGFSERQVRGGGFNFFTNWLMIFLSGAIDLSLFNGDLRLAALDLVVGFKSRSDGVVDFRSACGVASANGNDGPGYSAPLARHLDYCQRAPKKPNHYPWFVSNLNHFRLINTWKHCGKEEVRCRHYFSNPSANALVESSEFEGKSAAEVVGRLLQGRRLPTTSI